MSDQSHAQDHEKKLADRLAAVERENALLKAEIEEARKTASEAVAKSNRFHEVRGTHKERMLTALSNASQFLGIRSDIADHEQVEEAFGAGVERAIAILNASNAVIFLMNTSGIVLAANRATASTVGVEPLQLIGSCIFDFFRPDLAEQRRAACREVVHTGRPITYEVEGKDGRFCQSTVYPVSNGVSEVTKLAVYTIDITERKQTEEELHKTRLELERRVEERTEELRKAYDRLVKETKEKEQAQERLQQSQKMEAIGTLAGGIAHDFNNMLAVIIGNAELARDEVEGDGPARNLDQILNACKRSRELVKQILTFSRKNEAQKSMVKLAPLIEETANLLRGSLPSTISIKLDIRADCDTILANPTQMQQVIMNLATNAVQAMGDDGGTLALRLSENTFAEGQPLPDREMRPGRYLKITVRDTGPGIPRDIRKRIFDPFFTTKEPGQGTGMGLAVVFGIVKAHQGIITVESRMAKGTVFRIFLPLLEETREEEQTHPRALPTGNERVLVIDDEPAVVEMTSETLKRLGYKVSTARSAADGWRKFERDPRRFDLVITDHVMPEITGMRLAQRMLELRNDIPIILCTGYSEVVSAETTQAAGISELLMKPLARQEVAQTVRRVLDARQDEPQ